MTQMRLFSGRRSTSARARNSSREYIIPVGLLGELRTRIFVFGVIQRRTVGTFLGTVCAPEVIDRCSHHGPSGFVNDFAAKLPLLPVGEALLRSEPDENYQAEN